MAEVDNNAIGLCADCIHHTEQVSSKGSVFIRCLLAETDPRYTKYPRLPVIECTGFELKAENDTV
jgi:hypothetical protein